MRSIHCFFEGFAVWHSPGSEVSDVLISRAIFEGIAIPSFLCCYFVLLGKLVEFVHIVPLSFVSINDSTKKQQKNKGASFPVKIAVISSSIMFVGYSIIMIVRACTSSSEYRDINENAQKAFEIVCYPYCFFTFLTLFSLLFYV